jgi:hypothetical protein
MGIGKSILRCKPRAAALLGVILVLFIGQEYFKGFVDGFVTAWNIY